MNERVLVYLPNLEPADTLAPLLHNYGCEPVYNLAVGRASDLEPLLKKATEPIVVRIDHFSEAVHRAVCTHREKVKLLIVDVRHPQEIGRPQFEGLQVPYAFEVYTREDILLAHDFKPQLLIARGYEGGGSVSCHSSLVLHQLLREKSFVPYFIKGGVDIPSSRALLQSGASGVVLESALWMFDEFLLERASELAKIGENDTTILDDGTGRQFRFFAKVYSLEAKYLREISYNEPANFKRRLKMFSKDLLIVGLDAFWAKSNVESYSTLTNYLEHLASELMAPSACRNYFGENKGIAKSTGTRFPIFQGPMARISENIDFAQSVSQSGATPFIALSRLDGEATRKLLVEAKKRNIHTGVGLMGIAVDEDILDEQLAVLAEITPELAVVAAPRPELLARLDELGIKAYAHTPTIGSFSTFLEMGHKRFILEGCEAGGHIGVQSSLVLWQNILELVRRQEPSGLEIVFAGGLVTPTAVALLNGLVDAYGLGGSCLFGLQLGTAYLVTEEICSSGAMSKNYRRVVLEGVETIITGETLNLRVRQVQNDYARSIVAREREMVRRGLTLRERKQNFERENIGNLSKAVFSADGDNEGSYMAGDATVLLSSVTSIGGLHENMCSDESVLGLSSASGKNASSSSLQEPIAVIGMGCIVPDATTPVQFFQNMLNKKVSIKEMPKSYWDADIFFAEDRELPYRTYSKIGAIVEDWEFPNIEFKIPPRVAALMDKAQKWALLCARDALRDAGLNEKELDGHRTAVIIANSMGGELNLRNIRAIDYFEFQNHLEHELKEQGKDEETIKKLIDGVTKRVSPIEITEDTLPGELSNVISGRIAACFDLHGPNYTVDAACASGLAAVMNAVTGLQQGHFDLAITGGVDTQMGPSSFVKFSKVGALSNDGSFPFDERANGFVMGEGCCLFLLKRYHDALRDGDQIYGLIRGVGYSSDGKGKAIAAPNSKGQALALHRAMDIGGIRAEDMSLVEAHGTSTKAGDPVEMETVRQVFASRSPEDPVYLGSLKANIGHLRAAAGAAGLMKILLAVNQGVAPPQASYSTAHESHVPGEDPFAVNSEMVELERTPCLAGVSSFGFGGTNFHVVVQDSPMNSKELPIKYPRPRFAKKFVTRPMRRAFIFPGQSAQYVNMLAELRGNPVFEKYLSRAEEVYQDNYKESLIDYIYPSPERLAGENSREHRELLLQNTIVAQPAILAVSASLLEILRDKGIDADLAFGHSLGEYTALYAAGVLAFEDVIDAVTIRGKYMTALGGDDLGTMAFIAADRVTVERGLKDVEGYAICANINSPTQTIISGATAAVEKAVEHFEELGLMTRRLNVSAAFHSAIVEKAAPLFNKGLEKYKFHRATLPVSCNIDSSFYPLVGDTTLTDEEVEIYVRDQLTKHIHSAVDFITQIKKAYALGVREFIEVGPKNILTRLIKANLPGKPIKTWYTNHPKENTLDLLQKLEDGLRKKTFAMQDGQGMPSSPAGYGAGSAAGYSAGYGAGSAKDTVTARGTGSPGDSSASPAAGHGTVSMSASAATDSAEGGRALSQITKGVGPPEGEGDSASKPTISREKREELIGTVRKVVAEVSGYPEDMLEVDADFEADLGIDTIKIFEVFTKLRDHIPQAKGKRRTMSELTTIDKVVDYLATILVQQGKGAAGTASPSTPATPSGAPGVPGLAGAATTATTATTAGAATTATASTLGDVQFGAASQGRGGLGPSASSHQSADFNRAEGGQKDKVQRHRLLPYLTLAEDTSPTPFLLGEKQKVLVKDFGDEKLMSKLRNLLEERGHEVQIFSPSDLVFTEDGVKNLTARHGKPTVYLHISRLCDLQLWQDWQKIHEEEVFSLFAVAKAFEESLEKLVVITDLDGAFGLWELVNSPQSGKPAQQAPIAGALASLALALSKDMEDTAVQIVDCHELGVRTEFCTLFASLRFDGQHPIEGYVSPDMRVRFTLVRDDDTLDSDSLLPSLKKEYTKDSRIIVTGGAKGLGLHMVKEMDYENGPQILALGRSKEPSDELKKASGFGTRITYGAADVTDRTSLEKAVTDWLGEDKSVPELIVHSAGIEVSRSLSRKSTEEFLSVYTVKVDGLKNLVEVTGGAKTLVNFSSVAGLFGNLGQTDYAAANGFLDWCRPPGVEKTLNLAWAAWREIGMAARGAIKEILEHSDVSLIEPNLGRAVFFGELLRTVSESGPTHSLTGLYGNLGETYSPLPFPPVELNKVTTEHSLEKEPYLADHTIGGRCFLPAVVGLSRFLTAKSDHPQGTLAFEKVSFSRPIKLSKKQIVTTKVVKDEDNFTLLSQRTLPDGYKFTSANFQAILREVTDKHTQDNQLRRDTTELSRIKGILESEEFPTKLTLRGVSHDEMYSFFFHGPNFQVIKNVDGGNLRAFACTVDDGPRLKEGNGLSTLKSLPYYLEAALHTCGLHCLCTVASPNYVLPASVEKIVVRYDELDKSPLTNIYTAYLERGYTRLRRYTLRTRRYNSLIVNKEGVPVIALYGVKMIEGQDRPPREDRLIITGVPFELRDLAICVIETKDGQELLDGGDEMLDKVFSKEERKILDGLPEGKRRREWVAGRIATKILVRDTLRHKGGGDEALRDIVVTSNKKPPQVKVIGASEQARELLRRLRCSITHSGRFAASVLRVDGMGIGVDIEKIKELDENMLKDFATEEELSQCGNASERIGLWALKEACVKATGEGLAREPKDFVIDAFDWSAKVTLVDKVSGRCFDGLAIHDKEYCLATVRELDKERKV